MEILRLQAIESSLKEINEILQVKTSSGSYDADKWESDRKCSWPHNHHEDIKFHFKHAVALSAFSFQSSPGKQPIYFNLRGGDDECYSESEFGTSIYTYNDEQPKFTIKVNVQKSYNWYCFRVQKVAGFEYRRYGGRLETIQESVVMRNFKFFSKMRFFPVLLFSFAFAKVVKSTELWLNLLRV